MTQPESLNRVFLVVSTCRPLQQSLFWSRDTPLQKFTKPSRASSFNFGPKVGANFGQTPSTHPHSSMQDKDHVLCSDIGPLQVDKQYKLRSWEHRTFDSASSTGMGTLVLMAHGLHRPKRVCKAARTGNRVQNGRHLYTRGPYTFSTVTTSLQAHASALTNHASTCFQYCCGLWSLNS